MSVPQPNPHSHPHAHPEHAHVPHEHAAPVSAALERGWPSLMAMAAWQRLLAAAGLLALLWAVVGWALGGEA
ncbi:hypothetical protein [Crenobacter luteus]|uniref:Uncharacterized protein n=1 Tax=Crenobacter luteus TaxID=1452487 RepID=A0A165EKK9_9NEIS|nr:hypothetical protein [Crenobacter luteus]KZE25281.1 hypothetical protein AVW16_02975 [Crenobacter luteus]